MAGNSRTNIIWDRQKSETGQKEEKSPYRIQGNCRGGGDKVMEMLFVILPKGNSDSKLKHTGNMTEGRSLGSFGPESLSNA